MASKESALDTLGAVANGLPKLDRMEADGVTFPEPNFQKDYTIDNENTIFADTYDNARCQESIYGSGDGVDDLAAIRVRQLIKSPLPIGTPERTQNYEYVQRAMFKRNEKVEVIVVEWDKVITLEKYPPGAVPGVWDITTSVRNMRAQVNAISAYEQMDEQSIRAIAAVLDDGRGMCDQQGVFLPILIAAKINRDREEAGLPPLAAVVPVNDRAIWAVANLGNYSGVQMQEANNNVVIDLGTFRHRQQQAVLTADGRGAITLQADAFTEEDRLNLNSIFSGGFVMNAVADEDVSIGQYFKFPPIPVLWWSPLGPYNFVHNAPANNAQPEARSAQYWTNLAVKLALHMDAQGSLVRAYVRLATMITGERRMTPTGNGAVALRKHYWVMALEELNVGVPQPRGACFLVQLFGSQRSPKRDELFMRDFETLRVLSGRLDDLYKMLTTVGMMLALGFSTALLQWNITGRELGSEVITSANWSRDRAAFNNMMEGMFKGCPAGFSSIVNQACYHVGTFSKATVNVLCLTGAQGWCNGLAGVATSGQADAYWNLWHPNNRVPFSVHPFTLHHVINAYPANWGFVAPDSTFELSSYMNRHHFWRFDTSRGGAYARRSLSDCRYEMVPEGVLLMNVMMQRCAWPAGTNGLELRFREFEAATDEPAYAGILTEVVNVPLDGDGGLRYFTPGVLTSFDWETQCVRAPVVDESGLTAGNVKTLAHSKRQVEPFIGVSLYYETIKAMDYGVKYKQVRVEHRNLEELFGVKGLLGAKPNKLTVGVPKSSEQEEKAADEGGEGSK